MSGGDAASAVVALADEESSMEAIVGLGVVALRAAALRLEGASGRVIAERALFTWLEASAMPWRLS